MECPNGMDACRKECGYWVDGRCAMAVIAMCMLSESMKGEVVVNRLSHERPVASKEPVEVLAKIPAKRGRKKVE